MCPAHPRSDASHPTPLPMPRSSSCAYVLCRQARYPSAPTVLLPQESTNKHHRTHSREYTSLDLIVWPGSTGVIVWLAPISAATTATSSTKKARRRQACSNEFKYTLGRSCGKDNLHLPRGEAAKHEVSTTYSSTTFHSDNKSGVVPFICLRLLFYYFISV